MLSLLPAEYWNYRTNDMVRGLVTALRWRDPGTQPAIRIPGLGQGLPVRSARVAIVLALNALGLPARASVGVPLYCCPVVFKAIKAAGCRVRFIDVDPDTYCLSASDLAAKRSEVDAVVAVHMFGNVCDMPRLQKAAPGTPFIEDCAQALGSRLGTHPAGSFGEIAVFSFRLGKYLSVGEGGAICCGTRDFEPHVAELLAALPVPGRTDECLHVAATYMRSVLRRRPLWGLIGTRLWDAYNEKVSYTSKSPLVFGQIFQTDLALTIRRLPLLESWIDSQRSHAEYYSRNLAVDSGMLCTETPGARYNRLQYPLLVPSPQQCDRLEARLREGRISTTRPYKDIATIAATHYGYAGDCPQAERIARSVLVIPCNHGLERADVERITTCVNRAWERVGDGRWGTPAIVHETSHSELQNR